MWQPLAAGDGLGLVRQGRVVVLKWHRARRCATDTAFTGARIIEGLRRGASIEVDLNRHAGGGFAVLHDPDLDRETTGQGRVDRADAAALRGLMLRDAGGYPTDAPLMLLEDLADLVAQAGGDPRALLQLDVKTGADALTAGDIDSFGAAVARMGVRVILSSGDAHAVARLMAGVSARRTAGVSVGGPTTDGAGGNAVLIGHDPCSDDRLAYLRATGDYAGFVADALAESPAAVMIYLAIPLILAAADAGFDLIAAFHRAGRQVDAWTMESATPADAVTLRRLLDLGADQITTDDPVGLQALGQSLRIGRGTEGPNGPR